MTSQRTDIYAETLLVPDRLPAGVADRLERRAIRSGGCSRHEGFLILTRAVLGSPERSPAVARLGADNAAAAAIFARRDRVDVSGVAVMLIDEWFLRDLSARVLAFR